MAEDRIRTSEIVENTGDIRKLEQELLDALKAFEQLRDGVTGDAKRLLSSFNSAADGAEMTSSGVEQLASEVSQLEQRSEAYRRRIAQLNSELGQLQNTRRKETQMQRLQAKLAEAEEGSYDQLSAMYSLMKMRLNAMSRAQREGTEEGRRLERQARETYEEMNRLQIATGRYQLQVGNYALALRGYANTIGRAFREGGAMQGLAAVGGVAVNVGNQITSALGPTGAILTVTALSAAIGKAITLGAEFGRSISVLEQVSGASQAEISALEMEALRLGASTQFTSSEVAALELAYAKMGFKPAAILGAIGATTNAAIVSQEGLAETAEVTAATIRQFGLDTSTTEAANESMTRTSDVMAKSFSITALNLSKFQTAMRQAGPAAASVGQSLELTTAQIGALVNAGLQGEQAGTGLRGALLKLQAAGLTLDQGLERIRNSADPSAEALELLGLEGAVAGLILAESKDDIAAFNTELENSSGFAAEAAAAIQGDFQGSLAGAGSAMEAVLLATGNLIEPLVVLVLDGFTAGAQALAGFIEGLKAAPQFLKDNKAIIAALTLAVLGLNAATIQGRVAALAAAAAKKVEAAAATASIGVNNLLTASIWRLDAAMTANPIGLVIALLGALTAAFIYAYQKSETFRAVVDGLVGVFWELVEVAKEVGSSIMEGFAALQEGRYSDAAKSFAMGLNKAIGPKAMLDMGKRSAAAFSKGFADSKAASAQAKGAGGMLQWDGQQWVMATEELAAGGTSSGGGKTSAEILQEQLTKKEQERLAKLAAEEEKRRQREQAKLAKEQQAAINASTKAREKASAERLKALEEDRSEALKSLAFNQRLAEREAELAGLTAVQKAEARVKAKKEELQKIEQLNKTYAADLGGLDTREAELAVREAQASLTRVRLEEGRKAAEAELEDKQLLDEARFNQEKRSQQELTAFRLKQEIERMQATIAINQKFGGELTEAEIETLKIRIATAQRELAGLGRGRGTTPYANLYELLGLDIDQNQLGALNSITGQIKSALNEVAQARRAAADEAVRQSEREIDAARERLNVEIQNRNAGYANAVDVAQRELALAEANQRKALEARQKAQRAEARIQTAEQAGSLITASANIWRAFSGLGVIGPILAGVAIAGMFGSFAASKIRANQLARQEFGEGGLEILGGGKHGSGRDTPLGFLTASGKAAYGERDEAHMIIRASATKAIGPQRLNEVWQSLNQGTFDQDFVSVAQLAQFAVENNASGGGVSMDFSGVEGLLGDIRNQGRKRGPLLYHDSEGRLVREYRGVKTIYL